MINYTYGILCGDSTIPQDTPGYRFSDARPTIQQTQLLRQLMPSDVRERAASIDFYLKLLRSSSYWPTYVRKYDPINTYDTAIALPATAIVHDTKQAMLLWDASTTQSSKDFPYSNNDPLLYRICGKLFAIMGLNENVSI